MPSSNVGLGWAAGSRNYDTLEAWYAAKKATGLFEEAVCSGDLGSGFISMAATDFSAGALIRGVVQYDGTNHTALAKRRRMVNIVSNSGNVIMQDLWITDSNSGQPSATVGGAGNIIQRCFVENTSNTGTNSQILGSNAGGVVRNCIARCLNTGNQRTIRPSSTGIVENCIAIGGISAIYSEWGNSKTINSFAVAQAETTNCQNYPNGVPALNANNASTDGTPATGSTTIRNVDKFAVFVDFANNDFRIKQSSVLGQAGIGAFFYNDAGASTSNSQIAVTMKKFSVAASGQSVLPVSSTAANITFQKFSIAANGQSVKPQSQSTIAATFKKFGIVANLQRTLPTSNTSVAVTWKKFGIVVNAGVEQPANHISANVTFKKFTVAAACESVKPQNSSQASVTFKKFAIAAGLQSVKPTSSANVAVGFKKFTVAATAESVRPLFNTSIAVTMPRFGIVAMLGDFTYYSSEGTHIDATAESTFAEAAAESSAEFNPIYSTHIEWSI